MTLVMRGCQKFLIAMCSLIEYQYINCLYSVEKVPF